MAKQQTDKSQDAAAQTSAPQPSKNWIEKLALTSFRNYRSLRLNLDQRLVVLTGENGAGKTNILESLSLLGPGTGLRRAALSDLGHFESAGTWGVSCFAHGLEGRVQLGTGVLTTPTTERPRRTYRIDGQNYNRAGVFLDHLRVIWLTPAMDGLFTGPRADRCQFLDRLISTYDPQFATQKSVFERAMRQRNRLFELTGNEDPHFTGLEMQMAESGVAMAAARVEAMARLSHVIMSERSQDDHFPFALIRLEGILEDLLARQSAVETEDEYRHLLAQNRPEDRRARRALIGPHRSDMTVVHGPKNVPARLSSTGEQKALLTGLVLAHCKLLKQMAGGQAPLILLDEIAAHFDDLRRRALFEEIDKIGAQAFMTGTDEAPFQMLGDRAQFYRVKEAELFPY